MTYCVAIKLDSGMLFAADSRTNAGVDHIATFSKMRIFERKDDRMFVILSSGNLSVTQGVMNILDRHKHFEADRSRSGTWAACSMSPPWSATHCATYSGATDPSSRKAISTTTPRLLLGGQVKGEEPRLFNIYAQGNFIEAFPTPSISRSGRASTASPSWIA